MNKVESLEWYPAAEDLSGGSGRASDNSPMNDDMMDESEDQYGNEEFRLVGGLTSNRSFEIVQLRIMAESPDHVMFRNFRG